MEYDIEFKPKAINDFKYLPQKEVNFIGRKIEDLKNNLFGDVKKLTNFTPEYRLRVGRYRVLFEVQNSKVIIYRVVHRKDAY